MTWTRATNARRKVDSNIMEMAASSKMAKGRPRLSWSDGVAKAVEVRNLQEDNSRKRVQYNLGQCTPTCRTYSKYKYM